MRKICCLGVFLLELFLMPSRAGNIVIENESFKYVISSRGENLHFIDKSSNRDYLYKDTVSYCAYVNDNYAVDSVSFIDNKLKLFFSRFDYSVEINLVKEKDHFIWEIYSVTGRPVAITFLNIPLRVKALPREPFAACAMSLNLFTRVKELPAMQSHLWAACYDRFGIKGGRVAIIGVEQKKILKVIRDVMSNVKEMPVSTAGGAWAFFSKENSDSYIMNFGDLTEKTIEKWIGYCKSVGFNQIDNHGGADDFFSFGDFELNRNKWPEGWAHFARINERLHQQGISSVLHTYAFFIDKRSVYVSPVPSEDLACFRKFTLKKPLNENDSIIEVNEPLTDISLFTGFHVRNSVTLRIGTELIEFSGVSSSPPFRFTGCKRGANHTKISSHAVNDTAYHLKELFGKFVPAPETKLFSDVARRTADIVNDCHFDGIYIDAIDGSDILDGSDHSWYYADKFMFELLNHLKRPVGMEMSSMTHHFWNYRSRWQAWDVSRRGHKKFVDIHVDGINRGLLLPLQLGWWLNFTWDPPQTEHTFSDDVEYLGCKLIGYDASLSLLGGYEKKEVDLNPSFRKLNAIIKQYEELRRQHYFSEKIKEKLREPGKEFTLKRENGKWNFKPASYRKHRILGSDSSSEKWQSYNSFKAQPLKLRIHALMSVESYNDSSAKLLAGFSGANEFSNAGAAPGVTGNLAPSADSISCGKFIASSSGASPQTGAWIKMEKKFDPWLDLHNQQGLGVWIKGDGNNELLNIRLESPYHLSTGAKGDHFIHVDFKGWKYFELVELESSETFNYHWPDSNIYQSHMFSIQFANIDKLQVWYNNLPANKEITTLIGPVKALPLVNSTIENPSIDIRGKKIVFPVKMESGMYLEFNSMNDCKLYSSKGELLANVVPIGQAPSLKKGKNTISFSCDNRGRVRPRTEVTIISEGEFLKEK